MNPEYRLMNPNAVERGLMVAAIVSLLLTATLCWVSYRVGYNKGAMYVLERQGFEQQR
jgi:hypothetical protein